ncbi:hypothetical protein LSH36_372g03023, partial [Paralvinella palmiformis]
GCVMSVKLRASSGSYNVRASEMARDRPITKTVPCTVHFLDDTEATFEIDKRAKAQVLLDKVFEHLELIEKDYFGLQFLDVAPAPDGLSYQISDSPPTVNSDIMRWLDPLKTIKKQMGVRPPYFLYFRVKFYVSDPCKLHDEYTRYHFFLQLKKDIVDGKLVVPYKTAVILASYAVQYMFWILRTLSPCDCESLFLENVKELDQYGVDIHNAFWNPADAEYNYLDTAKRVDTYGVDLHCARVRDQSNVEIQLGVTSVGLVVFQNNVRVNTFSWVTLAKSKIVKISFKRKQFFIQLRREVVSCRLSTPMNDSIDNLIGFNMVSYRSCKNLWKSCVEHHTFFRLHIPPPVKSGFLNIGSKFRYRSPSKRYARRTVGASSREAILEENKVLEGYRPNPVHSQSVDSFRTHQDGYLSSNSSPTKSVANIPNSTSYPNSIRTPYSNNNLENNNGFQHTNHARKTLPSDYKTNEYPSLKKTTGAWTPTRNANSQNSTAVSNSSLMEPDRTPRSLGMNQEYRLSRTVENRSDQGSSRMHDQYNKERTIRPAASTGYHQPDRINEHNGSDIGHYSNTGSLRSNASTIRYGFTDRSSLRSNTSSQATISTIQDVTPAIPPKAPAGRMENNRIASDGVGYTELLVSS